MDQVLTNRLNAKCSSPTVLNPLLKKTLVRLVNDPKYDHEMSFRGDYDHFFVSFNILSKRYEDFFDVAKGIIADNPGTEAERVFTKHLPEIEVDHYLLLACRGCRSNQPNKQAKIALSLIETAYTGSSENYEKPKAEEPKKKSHMFGIIKDVLKGPEFMHSKDNRNTEKTSVVNTSSDDDMPKVIRKNGVPPVLYDILEYRLRSKSIRYHVPLGCSDIAKNAELITL